MAVAVGDGFFNWNKLHLTDASSQAMNVSSKATQRTRILALLTSARGDWVPLPQITACAAQYNARVYELRRLGFKIVNRTRDVDGVRHSWFRLESGPVAPSPAKLQAPHVQESPTPGPRSLFAENAPERLNYPD
jgi:hypothetical protein